MTFTIGHFFALAMVCIPCWVAAAETSVKPEMVFDAAGRGYLTQLDIKLDLIGPEWPTKYRPDNYQGADLILAVGPKHDIRFYVRNEGTPNRPTSPRPFELRFQALRGGNGVLDLDVVATELGRGSATTQIRKPVVPGETIEFPWLNGKVRLTLIRTLGLTQTN